MRIISRLLCLLIALSSQLLQAAPANDNFTGRIPLFGTNLTIVSSNIGATKEPGETNHAAAFTGYIASGKSVWYSWTPDVGGYVVLNLSGSFNKVIAIYTGASVANLSWVAAGFNNSPYDATCYFVGVSGTEYLIAVDGYSGSSGGFTLSLAETPPPPNDNFANRAALTGTNTTVTGSNVSASKEPGEPNHAGVPGGQSVWWTWTAPASGWVTFTSSGNFAMLLGVYTGDSVSSLMEVARGHGSSYSTPAVAGFNATAGTVYQIAVDGATLSDYSSSFTMKVVLQPPPANDNFAASTLLTGSNVDIYAASNLSATKEPGEPDHAGNPGGHSVWWVWTAPVSGRYAVSTDVWMGPLAPLDRLLGVYTGSSVSALTEVASASGLSNLVAKADFDAVQGTVYHIALDGKDGASGAFNLYLRLPPPNDDFANRFVIANTNVSILGTNANATSEPGEPIHANSGNTPPTSVWWKWTAPVSGRAVVTVTTGSYRQVLAVYTGTNVANLTLVDSSTSSEPAYASFDAVAGTEYEIAVDGGGGKFSLSVQYVPAPPNDAFTNRLAVTNTTGDSFYVTGSNLGATKEPGETWQGTASVWWSWTAPTNGEVLIELESTAFGTTMTYPWLVLYKGTTISNLATIYPRVEFAGQMHYHDARFPVVAGADYSIWVAGRGGVEGTYTLRGTFEPQPANDNFANRFTITNTPFLFQWGYAYVDGGYNVSATREIGEPAHYSTANKSVWWTWTAPGNGTASVGATPIRYAFSSMMGVYTGTVVSNLTRITNGNTTCTSGATSLTFPITANTTYQIAVDGSGSYGDSGEFRLELDIHIDTNAPVVTITNPVAGQAMSSPALTVGGIASDPPDTHGSAFYSSGVKQVEVRLNGGAWQPAAGTNAWSLALMLNSGANAIEARCRDAMGNYSSIASVIVTSGTPITQARLRDGAMQLSFATETNRHYDLQCAPSLVPPVDWQPVVGASVDGCGSPMTLSDTNCTDHSQGFYRLQVQ